ncbi:HEAT repeat domain-containing protein [Nitrospira sp. Kam-Ns4a]
MQIHPSHLLQAILLACTVSLTLHGIADPAAVIAEKRTAALQEAQAAYKRKAYDQALALLESLTKDGKGPAEAYRLKARCLLRLGKPQEALTAYDQLAHRTGREEAALLREVALGFVTPLLKDMREQMRGAAYTALKELESEEAIPYFEDALTDGSGLVRALAVEALGQLPAGQRSPAIRKALEDQAALVRATAIKVLGQSGDRAVIPLVERSLSDEHPSVRVAAAAALAMLGQERGWARLQEAAAARNPEERAAALRLLGDLRDRRALPWLEAALSDEQPSVRGAAVAALGDLGQPEAAPGLVRLLSDPIPAVRAAAALGLGGLGTPETISALKRALRDENPVVRAATVNALLQQGVPYDEVRTAVQDLTRHLDPGIRAAVARTLAKSSRDDAGEVSQLLRQLIKDPLPRPRIAAARALGRVGGKEALPMLKEALLDQDDAVRATAGGAIARILRSAGENYKSLKTR